MARARIKADIVKSLANRINSGKDERKKERKEGRERILKINVKTRDFGKILVQRYLEETNYK